MTRLTLVCAGGTAASRIGAFPSPDDPLDEGGVAKARGVRLRGPAPDIMLCSPARAAAETAEALGLDPRIEPLVADLHFGEWTGRTLADLRRSDGEALEEWLADPVRGCPGGEAMQALVDRMGIVIDRTGGHAAVTIVTHAAPMRAAIVHTLSIPLAAAMRVDVAPLSMLVLSHHGHWRLQHLGRMSDEA